MCFVGPEVKQAAETHQGKGHGYDESAVGLPDDLKGNRTRVTDSNLVATDYEFDALDRLTVVDRVVPRSTAGSLPI